MTAITSALSDLLYGLLLVLAQGVLSIVGFLSDMFEIMAGLTQVKYNGSDKYLIEIFFSNSTIANAYWGMALIGIVLCFGFAIIAVIRKMFDSSDKVRQTMGQIIGGMFKGMLMIICTTAMILAVVHITNVLLQRIDVLLTNADNIEDVGSEEKTNTGEEFATMAKIYNTIGNYALNESYNSRYNINSCYNEIRPDLQYLQKNGTFDVVYEKKDESGNIIETWQSAIQKIINSADDLSTDMDIDRYDERLSEAILNAMDNIRSNTSFRPMEGYKNQYVHNLDSISLDKSIFLMATYGAANNSEYNVNPSLTDAVRGPYYTGQKSIYSKDLVNDFKLSDISYVIIFVAGFKVMYDLAVCIFNCGARIFNLLLLYLISPPVFAAIPMDDGSKAKQWSVAFVVQSFGVFASVIGMRLLMIFIPVIMSDKLVLVQDNAMINVVGKVLILMVAMEAVKKSSGMVTGILSDSAGWQSVSAGDMSDAAKSTLDKYTPMGTAKQKLGSLREKLMFRGAGSGGGSKGKSDDKKSDNVDSARKQGAEKDTGSKTDSSGDGENDKSSDKSKGDDNADNGKGDIDSARNQGKEKDTGAKAGEAAKPKNSISEFLKNAKPRTDQNGGSGSNPESARKENSGKTNSDATKSNQGQKKKDTSISGFLNRAAQDKKAKDTKASGQPENVRGKSSGNQQKAKPKNSISDFLNNAKPSESKNKADEGNGQSQPENARPKNSISDFLNNAVPTGSKDENQIESNNGSQEQESTQTQPENTRPKNSISDFLNNAVPTGSNAENKSESSSESQSQETTQTQPEKAKHDTSISGFLNNAKPSGSGDNNRRVPPPPSNQRK